MQCTVFLKHTCLFQFEDSFGSASKKKKEKTNKRKEDQEATQKKKKSSPPTESDEETLLSDLTWRDVLSIPVKKIHDFLFFLNCRQTKVKERGREKRKEHKSDWHLRTILSHIWATTWIEARFTWWLAVKIRQNNLIVFETLYTEWSTAYMQTSAYIKWSPNRQQDTGSAVNKKVTNLSR